MSVQYGLCLFSVFTLKLVFMFAASSGLSGHSAFWGRLECWGGGVIGGHSPLRNRNPQALLMPSLPATALCFWEDDHEVALDKELLWDPRT